MDIKRELRVRTLNEQIASKESQVVFYHEAIKGLMWNQMKIDQDIANFQMNAELIQNDLKDLRAELADTI